jgi:hypothetical protein
MLVGLHATTVNNNTNENECVLTQTRSELLKSPSQGSSGSYSWFAYTNNGH